MNQLGEVVRRRRLRRGWSLEQLARKTSATKTAIHKIETGGTASPSVKLMVEIALAFGDKSVDAWLIEAGMLPNPDPGRVWTPELVQIQQMLNELSVLGEAKILHEALQLVLAIAEQAVKSGGDGQNSCNALPSSSL